MNFKEHQFMKVRYRHMIALFGDSNAILLMSELMNSWPVLNTSKIIDGLEYRLISNDFINKSIGLSAPTIRRCLNKLQEEGLIKVSIISLHNCSVRYIHIPLEEFDLDEKNYSDYY